MSIHYQARLSALALAVATAMAAHAAESEKTPEQLDELVVESEDMPLETTHYTSPSVRITEVEAEGINATTAEDFIKYEPGLVVRRRYIGDSNGVVGIRGSNMFQTARTLVYADGLPLHSLLETRWNGAPRWSLVAADEIESMEVVYGPFSAEYSGNAMGGVINIDTRLPSEREFRAEAGAFVQDFQHLGADDSYTGHREFISYGDRFDDLSLYLFHNHLDNQSQPMTFYAGTVSAPVGGETLVSGGFSGLNANGSDVIWYGDSGAEDVTTDLTKLKLGYDLGNWQGLFTLAFENRDRQTAPNSYVVDASGNTVWGGSVVEDGQAFSIGSWSGNPFAVSDQNRQSLLLGGGLEGEVADGWVMNVDVSWFGILQDETHSSSLNPQDPAYTPAGRVKEYDDTGWVTLDLKARSDRFMDRQDMNIVTGYHLDRYSLNIHDYNSDNYVAGEKTSQRQSSGGKTSTQAVFAQWGWDFVQDWDVALGGRYEYWQTLDGYLYRYTGDPADLQDFADRSETGFSPKFSLGFEPAGAWKYRYSLARAYRFPIVEELYKNEDSTDGSTLADADLGPETGIHQNLMLERAITDGFVRFNLFHEVVRDAIYSQTDVTTNISTFLPVDEVTSTGLEFILQQDRVLASNVDLRFNVAYTDSEITANSADPTTVGNDFPRIPQWRANMLATYHMTPHWDSSLGVRYASDTFGRLDNTDTVDQVYGAQDGYLFADLKASYQFARQARLSFGIDNVTDEVAFVAHPWPQRTYYLQGSVDF